MKKNLLKEMNVQINKEIFSAYLYLSMAAYFDNKNLGGFAFWMEKQAEEEMEHAMKFYHFINEIGERVVLDAISKPESDFGAPVEIFKKVLEHEQYVTSRIHLLYGMAVEEKDYATQVFLQWFVEEQVEEEDHASDILEKLKLAGESGNALLMLDKVSGERKSD